MKDCVVDKNDLMVVVDVTMQATSLRIINMAVKKF